MAVHVEPITATEVPAVAEFLHAELNSRVSVEAWARALSMPWKVDAPNAGFLLRDGNEVVGAYLAFYSTRDIGGKVENFCNLGAWCVRPGYRVHSLRLLKALLAQPGYHFTDLSPSGPVIALNRRLGFQHLDTTTALAVNLPWPPWPGRVRLSADPRVIEATLRGRDLEIYRDHRDTAAAHHVVLTEGARWCYVIFRRDRRKDLPLFASLLHVSDPELLRRGWRTFSRHLLLRHRIPFTLAELRIVAHRPRPSHLLRSARPKMFKSAHLTPDQVDYLYSELTCVAW